MAGIPDLRATRIATNSLQNDVANLARFVEAHQKEGGPNEEEAKVWAFAGHQGRRVLVDRRNPTKPENHNPRFTASSWKVGDRATEINPVTGQHTYDTGNLYRTVHWKAETFGLNGRFTNSISQSGAWCLWREMRRADMRYREALWPLSVCRARVSGSSGDDEAMRRRVAKGG